MKKTFLCLMGFFLILSGCSAPDKIVDVIPNDPIIKNEFNNSQILLLELHNKERKNKKIKELELDKNLCEYAQKHAEKMANKDSLYHSKMSDLLKASKSTSVGENIAWGQEVEIDVVNSWMWSPLHKWNILGKSFEKVGFGIAKNKDGMIYWCAVFSNKEV
jgi:uncharacterized protein YkwD